MYDRFHYLMTKREASAFILSKDNYLLAGTVCICWTDEASIMNFFLLNFISQNAKIIFLTSCDSVQHDHEAQS